MAPVRRTLVATWRDEGSSSVANTGEEDGGNSSGPSGANCKGVYGVSVVGSGASASHCSRLGLEWAETGQRLVGLWKNLSGGGERKWVWG